MLAEKFQTSFFIFICNPRTDATIEGLPNVFVLKGVENLTEITIALTKAFHNRARQTREGTEKFLKIKKMFNQRYLESELPLGRNRPKW